MTENKKVIGICSIGSGVGQSVITSCNATSLPIKTIGLGNNPLAYGQYECDDYAYIPSYYQKEYLNELIEICRDKKIDLLIPGHDDEAQILAVNATEFKKINVDVLTSSIELINICRSKDKLGDFFSEAKDLFVKSYTYDEIVSANKFSSELNFPLIAKPKNGYASRDVYIVQSKNDVEHLGNKLIYQEIAIPEKNDPAHDIYMENLKNNINTQIGELSIQLLADKKGKIQGIFSSYNKLNNGIPIEILPYQSRKLDKALDRLIPMIQEKGLKGPINLQGRMTDQGLKIFEINPRFTGITGLRAKFGFNEVAACIKHWLFDQPMQKVDYNKSLAGIRQTADKVVNWKKNAAEKYILITGSTGAVGQKLVKLLGRNKKYIIYTLDRSPEKSKKIHGNYINKALSWDDIESDNFNLGLINTLCHFASARPFHSDAEISDSLAKTHKILTKSVINGVQEIIYTSSQSIYGKKNKAPITENSHIYPETNYALAKYAGEQFIESLSKINKSFKFACLRLATLTGDNPEFFKEEAIFKMVKTAYKEKKITINGGDQKLNRMHIDDAANAIKLVLDKGINNSGSFNVSYNQDLTIFEISKIIQEEINKLGNEKSCKIEKKMMDCNINTTLDSTKFRSTFDWGADYDIKKAIRSIILNYTKKQEK